MLKILLVINVLKKEKRKKKEKKKKKKIKKPTKKGKKKNKEKIFFYKIPLILVLLIEFVVRVIWGKV